jgi:hypothetical protein
MVYIFVSSLDRRGGLTASPSAAQFEIEQLDEDGKSHREVGVAFRDMEPGALRDEIHSNQQKKAQRQHFDCRVTLDKAADRSRKNHHRDDGQNDRHNHDRDFVHHPDCGDDRVNGKDNVEQNDLRKDTN